MISHIWNLKYDTKERIYEKETGLQTKRTDVAAKGEKGQGKMAWIFGVSKCKPVYIEQINNKVLLYSTGNYIQFLVISNNGKEYKKRMCIYVYELLCSTAEINVTL